MFRAWKWCATARDRSWRSNERYWLIGLSVFIMLSGAVLAAAALYLTVTTAVDGLNDKQGTSQSTDSTAYNTWIALTVTGCFQVLVAVIGIIAADKVSLYGLVLYFWLMALVMGAMFLFAVTALNFQYTFQTWIRHHWVDEELIPARKNFCYDSWDTFCAAPLAGYPYPNQTAWCWEEHHATNCTEIQETALESADNFVSRWMNVAGGIAISSVAEMLACLYLILRLVTVPIVMRSMQSIINYFLVFPIVGALVIGWALSRFQSLYEDFHDTLTILFYFTGGLLVLCAVIGVVAGHLRHRKLLYLHVATLALALASYFVLLALMFYIYATLKLELTDYTEQQTWDLACDLRMHGCCCCEGPSSTNYKTPACPEWTMNEMIDNGAAVLKVGAVTVLLDVVFVVCSLVASLVLLQNLKGYEAAYV